MMTIIIFPHPSNKNTEHAWRHVVQLVCRDAVYQEYGVLGQHFNIVQHCLTNPDKKSLWGKILRKHEKKLNLISSSLTAKLGDSNEIIITFTGNDKSLFATIHNQLVNGVYGTKGLATADEVQNITTDMNYQPPNQSQANDIQ